MAYNKALQEKKWHLWKEIEEKKLRQLGVGEDVIKILRDSDWEDFKAERRFFEHFPGTGTYLDWQVTDEPAAEIRTAQDLLDDIDNEKLHKLLMPVDKLTLQIAIWIMDGYSSREIAKRLNLSEKAVYRRLDRLKEKIKKIL